jgi:hypothetical protein
VDKKLRSIPEYSGLIRDCVDRYFEDISAAQSDTEDITSSHIDRLLEMILLEKRDSSPLSFKLSPRFKSIIDQVRQERKQSIASLVVECVTRCLIADGVDVIADLEI